LHNFTNKKKLHHVCNELEITLQKPNKIAKFCKTYFFSYVLPICSAKIKANERFIQELKSMFAFILTVTVYVTVIALASSAAKHFAPQKPFDAR
jgi:hypothetical protein